MTTRPDDDRTPFQIDRDRAEQTGTWPESWGPFHRHFANDAVHRDGGPECDQPGTPRRVYVFDPDALDEHERIVARWGADLALQIHGETGRWTALREHITEERAAQDELAADHAELGHDDQSERCYGRVEALDRVLAVMDRMEAGE